MQRLADGIRVAGAQRRHQVLGHVGLADVVASADLVELGVDLGLSTSPRRRTRAPTRSVPRASTGEIVSPRPAADRDAAGEAERHVAAELGRQRSELVAGGAGPPQRVARDERPGGVRAAPREAAGHGDRLVDAQGDTVGRRRTLGEQPGGLDREVGRRRAAATSWLPRPSRLTVNSPVVCGARLDLVVQGDGLVDRGDVVVAVGVGGPTLNPRLIFAGARTVTVVTRTG